MASGKVGMPINTRERNAFYEKSLCGIADQRKKEKAFTA